VTDTLPTSELAPAVPTSPATPTTEGAPPPAPTAAATPRPAPGASSAPLTGKAARDARYKAKLRAQRAAAAGQPAAKASPKASPATPATPPAPAGPPRTDADRLRDLIVFVRVAWRVAAAVASLVGGKLDQLTDTEVGDQAATLVPLAARSPWFDGAVAWLAAPFLLLDLVARKLHRKAPATSSPPPQLRALPTP
jgi:hypothetical protein